MLDFSIIILFIFVTAPLASSWAPYRKPPTEKHHKSKIIKTNVDSTVDKYDKTKFEKVDGVPLTGKHDKLKFEMSGFPHNYKNDKSIFEKVSGPLLKAMYDDKQFEKVNGPIYFLKNLNMRPQATFDENDLKCQYRNKNDKCVSYVKNKVNIATESPVVNNNGELLRTPHVYDSDENDDYINSNSRSIEDLTRIGRLQGRAHGNVSEDYVDVSNKLLIRDQGAVKPEFDIDTEQRQQLLIDLENALRKPPVIPFRKSLTSKKRKKSKPLKTLKKTNLNITFTPLKYYRAEKNDESESDEDDSDSSEEDEVVTVNIVKTIPVKIVPVSDETVDEPVTLTEPPLLKKGKKKKRNRFTVINNEKIKSKKKFKAKSRSDEKKDSDSDEVGEKKSNSYKYKSDESYGSSEKVSSETHEQGGEFKSTTLKPKKKKKKKGNVYMYMQGPQRQYTDSEEESRRFDKALRRRVNYSGKNKALRHRLNIAYKNNKSKKGVSEDYIDYRKTVPMFLPKRYFWKKDQLLDLGYFWFNGPQGHTPDGRCQVRTVPVTDRPMVKNDQGNMIVPILPGTSSSSPVFATTEEVSHIPCQLPPELLQRFIDNKDLIIVENSTDVDVPEGMVEINFAKGPEEGIVVVPIKTTTFAPIDIAISNIKKIGRLNYVHAITYSPLGLESQDYFKHVGRDVVVDNVDENVDDDEGSQENEKEHSEAVYSGKKGSVNVIHEPESKTIKNKDMGKANTEKIQINEKRTDEPDSVSAETKNELNKYLENGIKSEKILNIINIIKRGKALKTVQSIEKNNKPNININIYKIIKQIKDTEVEEKYSGKKSKHLKTDITKTNKDLRIDEESSSDSVEKKIEIDNIKFNKKLVETSTVKNTNVEPNSDSVEKKIALNNDKYHAKGKIKKKNRDKIFVSSERDDLKGIKLLETNVHSESDTTEKTKLNEDSANEIKNKKSNKKRKKKIKYHESDSTEKISGEISEELIGMDIGSKKIINKINKHKKNDKNHNDDNSDVSAAAKMIKMDKITHVPIENDIGTDRKQLVKTTLKPKRKKKKDLMYMQGPHTIGGNFVSTERKSNSKKFVAIKNNRRNFENKNKGNGIIKNRRVISDFKNYWSVPFYILRRKKFDNFGLLA